MHCQKGASNVYCTNSQLTKCTAENAPFKGKCTAESVPSGARCTAESRFTARGKCTVEG